MAGLWMVKDIQSIEPYFGNPVLNVYGYKSNLAVINEAQQLATEWLATMLPVLLAIQNVQTYHVTLEVIQLDGTGYFQQSVSGSNVGTRTGDFETKFIAWGFKYNRATVGQRSGAKRIGLVADADVSHGQPVGGMAAPLAACAAAMAAPIQFGAVDIWFPEILERPANPGDPWGSHPISGVSFTNVTSQNTRKR